MAGMGTGIDINALLERKYANQTLDAQSQANLQNTQASVMPGEAAARNALMGQQASKMAAETQQVAPNAQAQQELMGQQGQEGLMRGQYYGAAGNQANAAARWAGPLAMGQIGVDQARSEADRAAAEASRMEAMGTYYDNFGQRPVAGRREGERLLHDTGLPDFRGTPASSGVTMQPEYQARGTAAVQPRPGSGAVAMTPKGTDTVPAMLTPGEAVLNHHAAELIGRDKIAAANAIGDHMAKSQAPAPAGPQGKPPAGKSAPGRGMIQPKGKASPGAPHDFCAGASRVPGYAEGTPFVQPPPGPGQTVTNGSWSPSGDQQPAPPAQLPLPAGVPAGTFGKRKPQALARGTHMVGHGKSAKTPSKIDPAALMGLLGAMRGGGGMPPPGGMMPPGGGGAPPPPAMG